MELTKQEIYKRLCNKTLIINRDTLINRMIETRDRSIEFLEPLLSGKISGYERNDQLAKTNPLLWEFGHVVFFWKKIANLLIENKDDYLHIDYEKYDSFIINRDDRWIVKIEPATIILKQYFNTIDLVINKLHKNEYTPTICYLILLGLYHNEWHNESFVFTRKVLDIEIQKHVQPDTVFTNSPVDFEFIDIPATYFRQGVDLDISTLVLDNEMPSFTVKIDAFSVSKHPITEFQYLLFVKDNGYLIRDYWCEEGWQYIKQNNITEPLYWKKVDDCWKIKHNYPMMHVSWYEACAYCRYLSEKLNKKIRLPTEAEWEYLASTYISTDITENAILDYKEIMPVNHYKRSENKFGVSQLYGNVWEWCQDTFMPYDGYVIDPVYREVSYPLFGSRKVCKGGCWATPKYMVTQSYRNAQEPGCRYQFTGFRVVAS